MPRNLLMTPAALVPRILVVDDHEANVQVLGAMLEQLGYEIIPATGGNQALHRIAARPPDLVLLDVFMPDIDGFEVCRRIREEPAWNDIPIIFLSSADDKDFIVRALALGGVDYVTKPFHQAELISRVRTHLALKAARDSLRRLAEDKDELIGILAHDLKNHLGGMQMSAQLLHRRANDQGNEHLERMSSNILYATDQMFSFVKEFLANASTDRGLPLKMESVSYNEIAGAAVRQYSDAAQRKEILLNFESADDGALVMADRGALGQVFDNLISNALKFSPPGRNVWVTIGPAWSGECRIQDEGPGFTEEDKALMFRRYRRLSARPTGSEPSTGLGLSIVKKLMDAMEGELRCESSAGKGATFIVTMPVATAPTG